MIGIEKETWRQGLLLSHGASWMQANVYLIHRGDQKIVIKDFSDSLWLIRCTFCRVVAKREMRAMQLLDGSGITPRYFGQQNNYVYAMEYIDGENFKFKKHIKNNEDLLALGNVVKRMHDLGVTHNDLHGKNIIVGSDGKFYFIDFASAFFKNNKQGIIAIINNKLFDFFELVDSSKISKLKKKFDSSTITLHDQHSLNVKKITSFIARLWKKIINEPLLRKRTWQKRKERVKKWLSS